MSRTTATLHLEAPLPVPRAAAAAAGVGARLLAWAWPPRRRPLDAREAYLGQAVDHQDLERRLRAWEAHEQRLRALTFTGW